MLGYILIIFGFLLQYWQPVMGWLVIIGGVLAVTTDYFDIEKEAKARRKKQKNARLTF